MSLTHGTNGIDMRLMLMRTLYACSFSAVAARTAFLALALCGFLVGCSTTQPLAPPSQAQSKVDLLQLVPGLILITTQQAPAAISYDPPPPNSKTESIADGAASATRAILDTPQIGHGQIDSVISVIGFVLTPFAATYGAVAAGLEKLTPDKQAVAERSLAASMRSNALPAMLQHCVAQAARRRTHRSVACEGDKDSTASGRLPVSARLEVAVDRLQLKSAALGQSEFTLWVDARARLFRSSDGALLLDRPYHYQSGSSLFVDWARPVGLDGVAQTAYQAIAEQIAEDVFRPTSEPPILIGPGHEHSSIPNDLRSACLESLEWLTPVSIMPACGAQPRLTQYVQLCSLAPADEPTDEPPTARPQPILPPAGSVETNVQPDVAPLTINVFTRSIPQPLLLQKANGSQPDASSANMSDTEWALGGLENDQNFVVQALALTAAIPMGLWEQTLGSFFKHSRDTADKVTSSLNGIVARGHFEQNLADAVAQRLQAGVTDPVRRSDEPLEFALARLRQETGLKLLVPEAKADCNTALEIHVAGARLIGKKPNASSRALAVEIQATVFRTSDGQELYSCPIRYLSTERKLKEWTASDALLFRRELDACTKEAAAALAADLTAKKLANPTQQ
jgi:hypothetical protein